MTEHGFRKRHFTAGSFARALAGVLRHWPELRAARVGGRVNRAFAERVMLVVSQVNGCRYCSRFHNQIALRQGVSAEEIARLVALDLGSCPEREAVALAFAQHFAESAGQPQPEAWWRFVDYYGPQTSRDIMAYIRVITLGNLAGNTLDAVLYRLRGAPAGGDAWLGRGRWLVPLALVMLLLLGRWRQTATVGEG
ncbi:MAG: carboxymuconolactone decarboxylase family protein [Chloroflexota bacterium]